MESGKEEWICFCLAVQSLLHRREVDGGEDSEAGKSLADICKEEGRIWQSGCGRVHVAELMWQSR